MQFMYVSLCILFLAGLSSPPVSADGAAGCETFAACDGCVGSEGGACAWFECTSDPSLTHCNNASVVLEQCRRITDLGQCADPSTTPEPTTTFPTTTGLPDTTTTEAPDTTTTEAPDTTTTVSPDTTTTVAPDTTTDVTTTEVPTSTQPTSTEVPPTTDTPPTPDTPPTTDTPVTTDVPSTSAPPPPTDVPSPSPEPKTAGFSFGSFVGGIVFCLILVAGIFVGLKWYRRRMGSTGRYNNL